jgi:hypothetical protein
MWQAQSCATHYAPTDGKWRLAYATYDGEALVQPVAYAECPEACHLAANWSRNVLVETVSASVTHFALFALQVEGQGRPRLALYTGTGAGGNLPPGQLY